MFRPTALSRCWMTLISGDLLVAELTVFAVFSIFESKVHGLTTRNEYFTLATVFAVLYLASLYMWDGYTITLPTTRARTVTSIVGAVGTLTVLLALTSVVFPSAFLGRRVFLTYPLMVAVTGTAWRLLIFKLMPQLARYDVLIAGQSNRTRRLAEEISSREHLGFKFRGFLICNGQVSLISNGGQVATETEIDPFLSGGLPFPDLKNVVVDHDTVEKIPVRTLIGWRMRGIQVMDCQDFLERLTGKLDLLLLRENWLLVSPGFVRSRWRLLIKRLMDVVVAVSIGLLTLPITLITAIAIKLESRGPLFFMQDRVGLNNKIFKVIKFRSMREDAEKRTGPVFAAKEDPRVTRVGKIIRRFRIDELPQLINVINGEMSMIGPRPERPEFVSTLSSAIPLYEYRHSMKPGVTGWAQICYPYGAGLNDSREKLGFDLYYLKNWSLGFDAQIMLQTSKVVVFGRGAR
jgi:sugar transferase (PEP-CTERM system associated)